MRTHRRVRIIMVSGQIDVPASASSAVDAFVAKGQPPAVLLGHLAVLWDGGPGKRPPDSVAGVLEWPTTSLSCYSHTRR
jgi:hypothetical protein